MRVFRLAAVFAMLAGPAMFAGPAYAQTPNINLMPELQSKTPEEKEAEAARHKAYKESLRKIPDAKTSSDPWGAASRPGSVADPHALRPLRRTDPIRARASGHGSEHDGVALGRRGTDALGCGGADRRGPVEEELNLTC